MSDKKDLIDQMFSVGAHYGYSKASRHPSAEKFVFGTKGGVQIIDLEKTAELLAEAEAFVTELARDSKTLLFVSSKPEARNSIRDEAESINQPYVAGRWIGGTFTNFGQMKKRTSKLEDLKNKRDKGELSKFTKKEQLLISREIDDLESRFGGIADMKKLPQAIFVIDPKAEGLAVAEANKIGAKVIALLNTDNSDEGIDYPIYGNDASRDSVQFFVSRIAGAYRNAMPSPKE